MPAIKQPGNKSAGSTDAAEIRKLREEAEATRRDVARLEGRMDILEVFLKLDIKSWKPTETQKEFAKQHGIELPDALDPQEG